MHVLIATAVLAAGAVFAASIEPVAAQSTHITQQPREAPATDAKAGRAAEAGANATFRKALATGKSTPRVWGDVTLAAGLSSDAELAPGRTQEVAQQATDQVRARAPKVGAGGSGTITVEMSVAATPTNPPVIVGSTNLPDGTILTVYLLGDPPACVPRCGLEYNTATVQNGRFTSSLRGPSPLISDSYTVDIVTPMAHIQPDTVQSVIGKFGERLRGAYVVRLQGGKYVSVRFPRNAAASDDERLFGLSIRYTQKIYVAGSTSSNTAAKTQATADLRNWYARTCPSEIDFANAVASSADKQMILGAERRAKIDTCIARMEAEFQALSSNNSPSRDLQTVPEGSLAKYEAIMLPARRNVAIAYVASICQLRNSFYLGIFSAQQQRIFDRERALHRLTPNEWKKAAADSNRAWGEALWQIGSRARGDLTGIPCQTLRTEPKFLENLDREFLLLSADSQLNAEAATTAGLGR